MRTLTEEDIRTRAYKLWKSAGESTKCDAFWYQAEKELLAERARGNSGPRAPNDTRGTIRRGRDMSAGDSAP
jgi:hypothetical protein